MDSDFSVVIHWALKLLSGVSECSGWDFWDVL